MDHGGHRVSFFAVLVVVLLAATVALSFAPCADAARPLPPSPAAVTTSASAAYEAAKAAVSTLMEMLPMGPSPGGGGH
ncbi:hypothetical protein PR202_ga08779 [Eleusine coracana subsp. coracana]|uniref:Uncharacterized protein n=1 Tax=Eleusine coracana subsp. coracana TaxID=191504 RepID=A0AAV5C289_ELECO|nr:hypothetical protein QOZ80_1AG0042860 [Eleusine coracana subsp. coracana]GJM92317.1 hypothetical protein PR202_ga08779 [Eleusine coracana subsp. coracana]